MANQAQIALRHLERILNAHAAKTLANVAQVICFVTKQTYIKTVVEIWKERVERNFKEISDFNIRTTEEKEISIQTHLRRILRVVVVPNLPKNASVEWQVVAIEKPIVKTSEIEVSCDNENLILSMDEKGHIFFVSSTRHENWEQKWQQDEARVELFLKHSIHENKNMPNRGHMQVFGSTFMGNGDEHINFRERLLPCDKQSTISLLLNLIPVKRFADDNTSYVINGMLY